MAPALDAMGPALEKASFKTPKIPVISNVTAAPVYDVHSLYFSY